MNGSGERGARGAWVGMVSFLAVSVIALSGCSGQSQPSSPPSSKTAGTPLATQPTTTAQAGPAAFVAWAKGSQMGDRDMSSATDDALLSIGNSACDVMSTSSSFGRAVEDLTKGLTGIGATNDQTSEMIRRAVANLCPQYKGLLP